MNDQIKSPFGLAEAVGMIHEYGQKDASWQKIDVDQDPRHIERYVDADGKIHKIVADPDVRHIQLGSIDDLATLCNSKQLRGDDATSICTQSHALITISMSKVELVLDTRNGRELAELPLAASDELLFFERFLKPSTIDVEEFSDVVRFLLRDTLDAAAHEELYLAVSAHTGSSMTSTSVETSRGKASVSASVRAEASPEAKQLKEIWEFNVRPFSIKDYDDRYPVDVMIDPVADKPKWKVHVFQNRYDATCDRILQRIASDLQNRIQACPPILFGSYSQ
jgi:hypothetical protein